MNGSKKYYLILEDALPQVLLGVIEAKRALETGQAKTVACAVKQADISRSAFYKYKDAVLPFHDRASVRIMTFNALLTDTPGVLSETLGAIACTGANILTINQNIPVNGHAFVTFSADVAAMTEEEQALAARVRKTRGVLKFDIVSGESKPVGTPTER